MLHYQDGQFKALNFIFKEYQQEIIALNKLRNQQSNKFVPENVLKTMFQDYEPISNKEGFSEIIDIPFFKPSA